MNVLKTLKRLAAATKKIFLEAEDGKNSKISL